MGLGYTIIPQKQKIQSKWWTAKENQLQNKKKLFFDWESDGDCFGG